MQGFGLELAQLPQLVAVKVDTLVESAAHPA